MKNVAVVIAGQGNESEAMREVELPPGATSSDVIRSLGLDDRYLLSREGSSQPFARDEAIYDQVPDGGKLRATPEAIVGARRP